MSASDDKLIDTELLSMVAKVRQDALFYEDQNPVSLVEKVYQLWRHWANFELYIISPIINLVSPPLNIVPEAISTNDTEFVYTIQDYGNKMVTSKGEDMFTAGMSMCKLYFTIEKMIYLLTERLKEGGVDETMEVQVAFGGHELAQRKAFEVIINLKNNVIVTNFDPSNNASRWGENYLRNVKTMAKKGYGTPQEAPRDVYRRHTQASTRGMTNQ